MIPDIELYAPYIQAVFGSPEQDAFRIPFSLADRTARTQSHLLETFLSFLNLADSRLGASRVLTLLESAPVRRKFGIDRRRPGAGPALGGGGAHPLGAGPAAAGRVGLAGVVRKHLAARAGTAAPGLRHGREWRKVFKGILPYDDIEGNAAEVLGESGGIHRTALCRPRVSEEAPPLNEWAATLPGPS